MGIDRNSVRAGSMCVNWSRLGGTSLPGNTARNHQIQNTHGLCEIRHEEPPAEDSEESRGDTEQAPDDMALTRMHPPVQGQCDEQEQGLRPRAICRDPREHSECDPGEATRGKRSVQGMPDCSGRADASLGRGERTVCPGEPNGEPLLGAGICDLLDQSEPPMETDKSGPVCIWQTSTEGHHDPHEHTMGTKGPDREWQVQDRPLRRNIGKTPRRPRGSRALPTDSGKRIGKANKSGGREERNKRTILSEGCKEQSGEQPGAGTDPGSQEGAQQSRQLKRTMKMTTGDNREESKKQRTMGQKKQKTGNPNKQQKEQKGID